MWSSWYCPRRPWLALAGLAGLVAACDRSPVDTLPARTRPPRHAVRSIQGGEGNPFGVNVQQLGDIPTVGPMMLDSLQSANIGWIRIGVDWQQVQPSSTQQWLDSGFVKSLNTARWARDRGINVLLNLPINAPVWAAEDPGHVNCSPAVEDTVYTNFIGRIVQIYSDSAGVRTFSVGNEVNDPGFFCPFIPADWLPRYQHYLEIAADRIKAIDPTFRVVGFELAGTGLTQATMLDVNTALGQLGNRVDVLGVHSYGWAADVFSALNDSIPQWVPNKETWLTETDISAPNGVDELYQRDHLALLYSKFLHDGSVPETQIKTNPYWTKIFYWRIRNEANNGEQRSLFNNGWVDDPGQMQPRLAFYAYKYLASTYYQNNGESSVEYAAYHYDGPSYNPDAWVHQYDAYSIGPTNGGWQLWSIYFKLNPAAQNAAMHICYSHDFGYIVPTLSYCDGANLGPFMYDSYPHYVQQLAVWLDNPLPGPQSNDRRGSYTDDYTHWAVWSPMQACYGVSFAGYGLLYPTPRCNGTKTNKPSVYGWIESVGFYLNGDLR